MHMRPNEFTFNCRNPNSKLTMENTNLSLHSMPPIIHACFKNLITPKYKEDNLHSREYKPYLGVIIDNYKK